MYLSLVHMWKTRKYVYSALTHETKAQIGKQDIVPLGPIRVGKLLTLHSFNVSGFFGLNSQQKKLWIRWQWCANYTPLLLYGKIFLDKKTYNKNYKYVVQ